MVGVEVGLGLTDTNTNMNGGWIGPNGASVRPDGAMLQEVVRNFRGKNTTIYRILPGTHHPLSSYFPF